MEIEHLNSFGHLILKTVVGVESRNFFGPWLSQLLELTHRYSCIVFGGSANRAKDLKEAQQLNVSLSKQLKDIQMGLFRKELSREDIIALTPAQKGAYFAAIDAITQDSTGKTRQAPKGKREALDVLEEEETLQTLIGDTVTLIHQSGLFTLRKSTLS
jgi:hypothetical protein